jgi:hypothetical protein
VGGSYSQELESKKAVNVSLRERRISEKERTFTVCCMTNSCIYASDWWAKRKKAG